MRFPARLRDGGLDIVTLAEHYGIPADESVTDEQWLAEAGRRGWVVLMKDDRIRRRPAEQAAVIAYDVRCFVLTKGDLRAEEAADWVLRNLAAIEHACESPGPSCMPCTPLASRGFGCNDTPGTARQRRPQARSGGAAAALIVNRSIRQFGNLSATPTMRRKPRPRE